MSIYLLDTNTISHLIHNRSMALDARLERLGPWDSLAVSVVTEAEIRFGLACKPEAKRLAQAAELVLAKFEILPWTSKEAAIYASLRGDNRRLGLAAGDLDMLIAAHAVTLGAVLVTGDRALAKLSGGLIVENWATDLTPN